MSYFIHNLSLMEIVALIRWSMALVCLVFSLFDRISPQASLFLDKMLQRHIEEEFYQKIDIKINYPSSLSDEEEV